MISSRLALGTVQFGLNYGIANRGGKPSQDRTHAILSRAQAMGISYFDTASAYGDAERLLGDWKPVAGPIRIVSKFSTTHSGKPIAQEMCEALQESLLRLGLSSVYGYLLHDAGKVADPEWLDALAQLKSRGLVEKIGVSIYDSEQALAAAQAPAVDIIQVPYSLMDQRLDECGFFVRSRDKEIWARSVFVQGLLFLPEEQIPSHLAGIVPLRNNAAQIVASYGFTMQQAALLFSLGNEYIDKVLIGVDSEEQLYEYAGIEGRLDSFVMCRNALVAALRGKVPPYLVSPHKWGSK